MRLSVNVDHVATLRNARGGDFPCPVQAAQLCMDSGADGITVHLREDRRHIRDRDLERISAEVACRLNFEMAATEEMVAMAERLRLSASLAACCIVPEKRAELTTEGGLDVRGAGPFLAEAIGRLAAAGIEVSLFVEPEPAALDAARRLGAQAVELHTGRYAEGHPGELARIQAAAAHAASLGLHCHAGHGLTYDNTGAMAAIPQIIEVSIGHFLVSTSVFEGLPMAIRRMKTIIAAHRA